MADVLTLPTTEIAAKNGMTRDPALRRRYLDAALDAVPRLLAAVDRNSFGPSYGCCDRQFWHYRTAAFPSEMYQEAALPLAIAYARRLPGNGWYGEARLAETAVAALRFSARTAHADGSADDYYPFERALGAVVFSLQAQAEAYRLLGLDDADLLWFFRRRAAWVADHGESGRLTNHHALAALGLWRVAKLTGDATLRRAAVRRVEQVLAWQSTEGWFDEYGGADPGYQTVTIDCLAKLQREPEFAQLAEPLRRATSFARSFLHLDDGYGGEYGSRGTRHFYPHGFELSAEADPAAADLADGYLRALGSGMAARFEDDRMYVHPIASLLDAYTDWSPSRPAAASAADVTPELRHFPQAGLFARRDASTEAIVSTARGGAFHWRRRAGERFATHVDAGLAAECADGRVAVSQTHDSRQVVDVRSIASAGHFDMALSRPLTWVRFERAAPWKQALLHLGMNTVGRWTRNSVRRLLQRRVIAGGGPSPIRLTRHLQTRTDADHGGTTKLVVTDVIELTNPRVRLTRLAYASDLQAAYTAASDVYQNTMLQPWTDLDHYVAALNAERRVVIVREL